MVLSTNSIWIHRKQISTTRKKTKVQLVDSIFPISPPSIQVGNAKLSGFIYQLQVKAKLES